MTKYDKKILRLIVDQNFSLTELCPQYRGLSGATQVFCCFHENKSTKSARLYWDDDRDMLVLHCFAEHRTFTAYDYVDLIIVKRRGDYSSVESFLIDKLGEQKFNELYKRLYRI